MDNFEKAVTETLQRTNQFGSENVAAVSKNAKAAGCLARIQAAVTELEARGILRSSAIGAKFNASERREMLRHSFSAKLTKIAGTARDIVRNDETFVNKFRTPRGNRSDLAWLEAGRAFAADLPAVAAEFTDYGYDAAFVDELSAEADLFEASINAQDSSKRQRIDSNASIDTILGDALKALRTLKQIIPNIFSGDPGKLAEWTSASHIETKAKKKPEPPAPVTI